MKMHVKKEFSKKRLHFFFVHQVETQLIEGEISGYSPILEHFVQNEMDIQEQINSHL